MRSLWVGVFVAVMGFLFGGSAGFAGESIPAFPGAEGFGTYTTHGRGGEVIAVTNLNDNGPGSLRAAVNTEGPRIIVFRVSGIIELESVLTVREPYCMIAGQSAPGAGICLAGRHFRIATHDVVVRFLRVRSGDLGEVPNPDTHDAIEIADSDEAPYNIVIDHCSASWAIDENLTTWYACHDITFQWCITSEALNDSLHSKGPHSKGFLVGDLAHRISIHHTLFAHNDRRNVLFKAGTSGEFINNVIYNWGGAATHFSNYEETDRPMIVDLIGNAYIPGEDSRGRAVHFPSDMSPGSKVYLAGNQSAPLKEEPGDQRELVDRRGDYLVDDRSFASGLDAESARAAFDRVLAGAGAIAPERDAVDQRIVADVRKREGKIIDSVEQTPGYPEYPSAPPPPDSDGDGMPDDWEREHDLDPKDKRDGSTDRDGDGYTNVEEYLNHLVFSR